MRRILGRGLLLVAGTLLMGTVLAGGAAQKPVFRDTQSDTWVATDGLGRTLPGGGQCVQPRTGRTVGIFYFQWQAQRHEGDGNVYDISKIIAANPQNPMYGPLHAFHWWSEPHLGYYRIDDPFVIRKHAQMLVDAGVDVIILDATNAITYPESYMALCKVYTEMRAAGQRTPQLAFITWSYPGKTVQNLYGELYAKNLYPELWFRWKGKPLLLTKPEELTPELRDFFTVRMSWAWTDPKGWFGDGKDKWPWLDHTPQRPGWHDVAEKPEQISVAVAEHPTGNIGRSFHDRKEPGEAERKSFEGLYFKEQWDRALAVDPEFVFITGWNEWIAQRFVSGQGGGPNFQGRRLNEGETFFVDQYNLEFSRDIEPMKGGYGDAYYYQMVANIRRFKGVRLVPKASAAKTIRITDGFGQWSDVKPEYLDDLGDITHRDYPGWGKAETYTNQTGRNDFDLMKVARDKDNLYFYARTAAPITEPTTQGNWMTLLLKIEARRNPKWEGYNYAVRWREWQGKAQAVLCRNVGNRWEWAPVAPIELRRDGNELQLAIPRTLLDMNATAVVLLDFKWVDNVPDSGDILDFIDQGDVAPNGRFNYRYSQ